MRSDSQPDDVAPERPSGVVGYYDTLRLRQLSLVPERPGVVVEVGCGAGTALHYLKQERGAGRVIGIESFPEAAAIARLDPTIDEVIEADAMVALRSLAPSSADVVVASHVLEHLADPWAAVAEIHRVLVPGGVLVGALPNVRYLPVTARLLVRGRFDYEDCGVLDRTHLRFFTRSSIVALLEENALAVEALLPDFVEGSRMDRLHGLSFGVLKHHCAYAYDFRARKR